MINARPVGSIRRGIAGLVWPCSAAVILVGCAPAVLKVPPTLMRSDDLVASAWVQAGADGRWSVRALAGGAACPTIEWHGGAQAMRVRAEPAEVAPRGQAAQRDVKPAVFPLRSCEGAWPDGAQQLRVGAHTLQRPAAVVRRIVLVGDSGCRMKQSEDAYQDCLDPARWPFAGVAQAAAATKPDLVVHVGDIHYRESPCPSGRAGCAGSPWGYGEDVWRADFFGPAAPLLAVAPWVFVRGNHESCNRAGVGWFRFLDARPWSAAAACLDATQDVASDYTAPWAWRLSPHWQMVVFDSAAAAGKAYAPADPAAARYAAALAQAAQLATASTHNFFVNHHPVLAFGASASGKPRPGTASLLSVMQQTAPTRLYPEGTDAVLTGHVHLFQALGFSSGHPSALGFGNSGSAMEGHVDVAAALKSQPALGAVVATYATQPGFGFATLDRDGDEAGQDDAWTLTEWSVDGRALVRCRLRGARLSC